MFSQLGPLFKAAFRKTEKTNTRMDIRREDKDNPHRNFKKNIDDNDEIDPWEDSTSVSIEGLRNFLIDFLKSKGDAVPEDTHPHHIFQNPIGFNQAATNALRAYITSSEYTFHQNLQTENSPESESNKSEFNPLELDELKKMHILIAELDKLKRDGLENLIIEKSDNFIESLGQAIEKAKT